MINGNWQTYARCVEHAPNADFFTTTNDMKYRTMAKVEADRKGAEIGVGCVLYMYHITSVVMESVRKMLALSQLFLENLAD